MKNLPTLSVKKGCPNEKKTKKCWALLITSVYELTFLLKKVQGPKNLVNSLSFLFIFVLKSFFFSLVYFAEKDAEEKWSFLDSFWWGLMVLTTVGYGATAPSTPVGKVTTG